MALLMAVVPPLAQAADKAVASGEKTAGDTRPRKKHRQAARGADAKGNAEQAEWHLKAAQIGAEAFKATDIRRARSLDELTRFYLGTGRYNEAEALSEPEATYKRRFDNMERLCAKSPALAAVARNDFAGFLAGHKRWADVVLYIAT